MNSKPRLLDLFCGAGGAAMGYHRAGFDVVGVDIKSQKNYPFEFIQADAMSFPLDGFDVIHASPPCQTFTVARRIHGREYLDLLTPMRQRLKFSDTFFVIENVPQAPMRRDLILCGSMFGLQSERGYLRRHRWFEFSDCKLRLAPSCNHKRPTISVFGHGGHVYHGAGDWKQVMGIDWMTRSELSQAIPPIYTEWIGHRIMECSNDNNPKSTRHSP